MPAVRRWQTPSGCHSRGNARRPGWSRLALFPMRVAGRPVRLPPLRRCRPDTGMPMYRHPRRAAAERSPAAPSTTPTRATAPRPVRSCPRSLACLSAHHARYHRRHLPRGPRLHAARERRPLAPAAATPVRLHRPGPGGARHRCPHGRADQPAPDLAGAGRQRQGADRPAAAAAQGAPQGRRGGAPVARRGGDARPVRRRGPRDEPHGCLGVPAGVGPASTPRTSRPSRSCPGSNT